MGQFRVKVHIQIKVGLRQDCFNIHRLYLLRSKHLSRSNHHHDLSRRAGNRAAFIDRAKTSYQDHTHLLNKIQHPTIVIRGDQDAWVDKEQIKGFIRLLPNSQLVKMQNTGHLPMEERPFESAQAAFDFLISG